MKKLLVKFCIVFGLFFVGFSIVTAEGERYSEEQEKFLEGGHKNADWYDNRINAHSAENQDRINAIAADAIEYSNNNINELDVSTDDGISKIQNFLKNQAGYENPLGKSFYINDDDKDGELGWSTIEAMNDYCHIVLNTRMPFLGRCIHQSESDSAFPILIGHLMKIVLTLFFVGATIAFIVAGVLMASAGGNQARFDNGKQLAVKTIFGILVLGLLALLLHLINPNFFM